MEGDLGCARHPRQDEMIGHAQEPLGERWDALQKSLQKLRSRSPVGTLERPAASPLLAAQLRSQGIAITPEPTCTPEPRGRLHEPDSRRVELKEDIRNTASCQPTCAGTSLEGQAFPEARDLRDLRTEHSELSRLRSELAALKLQDVEVGRLRAEVKDLQDSQQRLQQELAESRLQTARLRGENERLRAEARPDALADRCDSLEVCARLESENAMLQLQLERMKADTRACSGSCTTGKMWRHEAERLKLENSNLRDQAPSQEQRLVPWSRSMATLRASPQSSNPALQRLLNMVSEPHAQLDRGRSITPPPMAKCGPRALLVRSEGRLGGTKDFDQAFADLSRNLERRSPVGLASSSRPFLA